MVEISLLRALLDRENYQVYRNFLSLEDFPKEIKPVLQAIDELQKNLEDSPDVEDVANILHARGIPEKDKNLIGDILKKMSLPAGESTVKELLESVRYRAISQQIAVAAMNYVEGKGTIQKILGLTEQLKQPVVENAEEVTNDINEILARSVVKPGLRWRLDCLNKSLGSLRKGNFLFIFARPEVGKTGFLASEVTHMVTQLQPEQGPVLWFCNEEHGDLIRLRQYQAALGARLEQIKSRPDRAYAAFMERTKGKLKLIDSPYLSKDKISAFAVRYKPSLIVIDQLDKVTGFDSDRKDLELGDIYQWARELSKIHCPVIGVSQADATAEGVRYLTMANIANSKTSKAAEADAIIGIGKDNSPGFDYVRFLSILKNKLVGDEDTDPTLRHGQFQVNFHPDISRYTD